MSAILSCTVDPTQIGFRWIGAFELTTDAIQPENSKVTTADGLVSDLAGWVSIVSPAAVPPGLEGKRWVYDVQLNREQPTSYQPVPGSYVTIKFELANGSRSVRPEAHAIVAAAGGQGPAPAPPPSGAAAAAPASGAAAAQAPGAAPAPAQPSGGDSTSDAGVISQLELLTGFPFQVYDGVGGPGGTGTGAGSSAGASTSAQAIVDAQMRAVLGRSAGTGGVTGTLAALDRSFQLTADGGNETWVWRPQSYSVQSDIGAGVTGEQASLARLAASVGDEILPLVNGLTPLVPESIVNPDEIAAARAIFNSSWPGFVAELGSDGGPRIQRATGLLNDAATQLVTLGVLLGVYKASTSLGNTGRVAGNNFDPSTPDTWPLPDRSNGVVTSDDEANFTNFVIASDRLRIVIAQFQLLYGPAGTEFAQEDRGFLIVLLQRALDATGEAAQAVYTALDSVNLGQDERALIFIPGTGPGSTSTVGLLSIEDVVSWAASFPSEEAASLLQDGGNLGVLSIQNRAAEINTAVGDLFTFATSTLPPLPQPGLSHPRVTNALAILRGALDEVVTGAQNPGLLYDPTTAKTP